ncbi:transaldolase family protein [Streptomyces sp. NPDC051956]|uniref:transaldolase family protein n=1 Tax=Streptomyces sp. NPDC051956 TaxID=3365677 RepID=UPI0037D2DDE0
MSTGVLTKPPDSQVWLGELGRQELHDGSLKRLIREAGARGIAPDTAHYARALARPGPAYDAHLSILARRAVSVAEATRELLGYDARWAADLLRPVHESSGRADGHVCVPLDPALAHDPPAAVAEARGLRDSIGRTNTMIGIPATPQGLRAITACLAQGINVNATLIFSVERYAEVVDAAFTGLEHARRAGHDLASLSPAASFVLGGLDAAVERQLDAGGEGEAVAPGSVAAASARIARRISAQIHEGHRWKELACQGARPHRLLWPGSGPEEWHDGGSEADAWEVLDGLPRLGICYRELTATLQEAALADAARSWQQVHQAVAAALHTRRTHQEAA